MGLGAVVTDADDHAEELELERRVVVDAAGNVSVEGPARVKRRPWVTIAVGAVIGLVIVSSLALAAWAVVGRAHELNEAIYQQCVRDETQDAILADILRAARAQQAIGSQAWTLLNDSILALEPLEEVECQPPEGVSP